MYLSVLWIDMNTLPEYGLPRRPVVAEGNFHNTGYKIASCRIDDDSVQGADHLTVVVFDSAPNI